MLASERTDAGYLRFRYQKDGCAVNVSIANETLFGGIGGTRLSQTKIIRSVSLKRYYIGSSQNPF